MNFATIDAQSHGFEYIRPKILLQSNMNVPALGPCIPGLRAVLSQQQDSSGQVVTTVSQAMFDKRLAREGDVDFSPILRALSMTHASVSTTCFMSRTTQIDGPDDTNVVNMDTMEMYLEFEKAADSKSSERYNEALEKRMLPNNIPNPTQAYQAHFDMFAFAAMSLGKFAFLAIPDRCNSKYPLRIGNFREAQRFDCIDVNGKKVMIRRCVLIEEIVLVDYLGE